MKPDSKENRRSFLKKSAIAGAAVTIQPIPFFAKGSPADKLVVAVMGVNSRGHVLAQNAAGLPNVEVAVICDVDSKVLDRVIPDIEGIQKKRPKGEKDIRKVLENKDIDAVLLAPPDHWHAPAAIMALNAGKHVYVEKPCSHNPQEGEWLIAAQKRNKRVLQMGNQRRSWPNVNQMMGDLRSGVIGRVYFAKGWYANNRASIGFGKAAPVPDNLDYELWQGPAPREAYRDNLIHYNWHWFTNWGTGEALNNGTHEIDLMRWGMGLDYPSRVVATGGRYHFNDDWQFPDTMVANFEFDNGCAFTWESRSCNTFPVEGSGRGVIFYGEKGTLFNPGGDSYTIYANDGKKSVIKEVKQAQPAATAATNTASPDANLDGVHIQNFFEGIRSGKPVNSPAEEGHKSVLMCQLANIAWRTGRILNIDPRNGHIIGDPAAMEHWGREYEPGWEPKVV